MTVSEKKFHNKFYKEKPDGDYMKNEELVRMFNLYFRLMLSRLRMHKDLKKCRVLSLGSGTGRLEFELAPHVKEVIGIDISNVAVKLAKKQNRFSNVDFLCAPATNLPFENEQFEAIVSLATIHHVKNKEKLYQEISRVLKKNGLFYAIEPSSWGILHKIGETVFKKTYDQFHSPDEFRINPFELKKNLLSYGFTNFEIDYCDFFFVPLVFLVKIHSSLLSNALYFLNRFLTIFPFLNVFSCQFTIFCIKT